MTAARIVLSILLVLASVTLSEVRGEFRRRQRPTLDGARRVVRYEVVLAALFVLAVVAAVVP